MALPADFFAQPATQLAPALLGKIIRHRVDNLWLSVRIVETEAYELSDKASHSSLGETHARRAMFMPPGTIYMYYARGADSLNFSALGKGNAVLIKSGVPITDNQASLKHMLKANPINGRERPPHKLCSGQTLLCKSLKLTVPDWNARQLDANRLIVDEDSYKPESILQCRRLGIPNGRDEHLLYRFVDEEHVRSCTQNPLVKKTWKLGRDYRRLQQVNEGASSVT